LSREIIGGEIRSAPHNNMYQELYSLTSQNKTDITALDLAKASLTYVDSQLTLKTDKTTISFINGAFTIISSHVNIKTSPFFII